MKTLRFAIAIIAVIALMPVTVLAARDPNVGELIIGLSGCEYELRKAVLDSDIGDEHVTAVRSGNTTNSTSGSGWSYDASTTTLTLDGYNGSGFFARMESGLENREITLTVKLIGENTVTNNTGVYGEQYCAIRVEQGNVEFQGPGTLNINANYGVNVTVAGVKKYTTSSGSTVDGPIAGRIKVTNGAKIISTTKWTGFSGPEMIVESGSTVTAHKTGPEEYCYAINATHLRCNGTLFATNANPKFAGIITSMYCTAGPNVTAYAGTSEADAVTVTLNNSPSVYFGSDTQVWGSEKDGAYMAMIEAGYNGSGAVTTPTVTAPTPPITTPPVTAPVTPPAVSSFTAAPTASTVLVNGAAVAFEAYNIEGSNYFKLRDLAYVLSGSQKQFDVGFDSVNNAIALTSGMPYTVTGGEMAAGDGQAKPATPTTSKIYLNGGELSLTVYNIGGNNFFKLVDLMGVLNIGVTYNQTTGVISIDTNAGFTGVVTVS